MHPARWPALLAVGTILLPSRSAEGAVARADIVLRVGDIPAGTTLSIGSIGSSTVVEESGTVAFAGTLQGGDRYIFRGAEVIWSASDDDVNELTGVELGLGTAPGGAFVICPLFNGADAIYTNQGLLAVEDTQAPGLPAGTNSTFHNRSAMTSSGQAWWVMGSNSSGGTTTEARSLMRSPTASFGDTVVVVQSGDIVDGQTIASPDGIGNLFSPSHNDEHVIARVTLAASLASDVAMYVDGTLVARESEPNGDGESWDNFDLVAVNNSGDYAFGGDTDGPSASDQFVAYNGEIMVREGDTVGGTTLPAGSRALFIGLSNSGTFAHAWSNIGGEGEAGDEVVFFSCDPGDLAGSSTTLLTAGDELDLDGDAVGDGVFVTSLGGVAGTSMRPLADDNSLYVRVNLEEGGTSSAAVIRVHASCCGNGNVEAAEECDDGNDDDTDACSSTCLDAVCGDGFVYDRVEECDDGNDVRSDACLESCVSASCGDGFLQSGVEACDDGNDDDTDACLSSCIEATCGDGAVQEGVEACDDGNEIGDDACSNDCQVQEAPGTGSTTGSAGGDGTGQSSVGGMDGSTTDTSGPSTTSGAGGETGTDAGDGSTGPESGAASDGEGCSCTGREPDPRSGSFACLMLSFACLLGRRRRGERRRDI